MKVFIVEDDKVLSLLLKKMILKFGYEVVGTAAAGKEAIEKLLALKPDINLMDIMLEDNIDGIDVMNALRSENRLTPVIYITGNSDSYNKERALETNYIDYLVKPISFDVLQSSIKKVNTLN